VSFPSYIRVFSNQQRRSFVAARTEERLTPTRRQFTVESQEFSVREKGPGAGVILEREEILKFAGRAQ
jgi:hypothetical protein